MLSEIKNEWKINLEIRNAINLKNIEFTIFLRFLVKQNNWIFFQQIDKFKEFPIIIKIDNWKQYDHA